MYVKLLKIDMRADEAGLWHVTSPDMPASHLSETSRAEVLEQLPIVLETFFKIGGKPVVAFQIEPEHDDDLRWVIVTVEYLRAQIAKKDKYMIPDFGERVTYHNEAKFTCKNVVPGLTFHDLAMIFERAKKEAKPGDDLSGNPSKWPDVRGVTAVTEAILKAIYERTPNEQTEKEEGPQSY